jgi:hypothetical protein
MRERIGAGNVGLRDPRSIVQGRNALFGMFGGKVPLRAAQVKAGEKPYLIARVGLNRAVLLKAAGSCVKFGSGGPLRDLFSATASENATSLNFNRPLHQRVDS